MTTAPNEHHIYGVMEGSMHRSLAPVAALVLMAGLHPHSSGINANKKQPWEWTLEERLAQRFDPARIRERSLSYEAEHPQAQPARIAQATEPLAYTIDGSHNPELFLPHELFDALLMGLSPDPGLAQRQQEFYGRGVRALGYRNSEFWDQLRSATSEYLVLRFAPRGGMSDNRTEAELRCRSRFSALEAARRTFGAQQFERILYEVVAPTMQYSETTYDSDPARRYREAEGGCRGAAR